MKADVINVGRVFSDRGDVHYLLPRFQRAYAWQRPQWLTLWNDVLEVWESGKDAAEHFLGAMVVISEIQVDLHMPTYTLVDGQQRLITLSAFLLALAENCSDEGLQADIFDYLTNRRRRGHLRYKVLPTEHRGDRAAWIAMVDGETLPEGNESGIPAACDFFRRQFGQLKERRGFSTESFFHTLISRMNIVFIDLQRLERPHQIFESLNTKGLPLTEPDKIRNYLAMRLPKESQDDAWERYWRPVEDLLDEREGKLTMFLQTFLTRITGFVCREDEIYLHFRRRMDDEFPDPSMFENELAVLHSHAFIFDRLLSPERVDDPAIRLRLERIIALAAQGCPTFAARTV